ncbi:MAG: phosphopantothenate/pantothenate synthetase [Planctomycetes bacterium]|nr:phosphopantothenate/pantothenate synthetase [Planctomycetota bacterium]
MTDIPDSPPRAASLRRRELVVDGVRLGITSEAGLIAHGRGEAFDYLLGERTHPFADSALEAASALIRTAVHPVLSVNGNVAALATRELRRLADENPELRFEVNLFHFAEERIRRIVDHLTAAGIKDVLGSSPGSTTRLDGLESARARMDDRGIAQADVVIVPLEDGDRCEALVASGRKVITVDLNPLSRTSQRATVTIVDELTRALPRLADLLSEDRNAPQDELRARTAGFDNARGLAAAERAIRETA